MSKFYHVPFYKSTFLGTWTLLNVYSAYIFCTHTVLCVDFTSLYDYSVPVVSWLLEYFSCRQISVIKSFTPPQKKNTWIMFLESNKTLSLLAQTFSDPFASFAQGKCSLSQQASRARRSSHLHQQKPSSLFWSHSIGYSSRWRPPRPILILPVFCYSDLAYGDCFFWWMKDGMKMFLLVLAVAENDTDWLQNKEMIYPPLVVVAWWSIQQFFGQKGL